MIQNTELFRDGLLQVRIDRNPREESELHVLDVIFGVEADDQLHERIGSYLID